MGCVCVWGGEGCIQIEQVLLYSKIPGIPPFSIHDGSQAAPNLRELIGNKPYSNVFSQVLDCQGTIVCGGEGWVQCVFCLGLASRMSEALN